MNVARRHHFVPKCYLASFTDDGTENGRLCVLDLLAKKFFVTSPVNVAVETDFNRVDIDGHPTDVLEAAFGELEGKAKSVIRRICKQDALPADEELSSVLKLIALLAVRNPAARRSMQAFRQHTHRIILDMLASDPRLYEHHQNRARADGFVTGPDVPFDPDSLRAEHKLNPQEYLETELNAFESILASVGARYWSLLVAAPDAPDFIACDHPVSIVYKQAVFPIGPRHALMGDRENQAPLRIDLTTAGVAEVNTRVTNLADRQVYSRTPRVTVLLDGSVETVSFAQLASTAGLRG